MRGLNIGHTAPQSAPQSAAMTAAAGCYPSTASEAQRQPELAAQMDRMDRSINEASELLGVVAARLEKGLLRPEPATEDCKNQIGSARPQSGYACTVFDQAERVDYMSARLHDILRRLEA